MNISLEYFLIVAQEQSISRGAERAMVSQQDMSNHIRVWKNNTDVCLTAVPNLLLHQLVKRCWTLISRYACWSGV